MNIALWHSVKLYIVRNLPIVYLTGEPMTLPPERKPTEPTPLKHHPDFKPLELVEITLDIKRQAQAMLFIAKSTMHKAQQLTEVHDQLGQEHWHPRGPMLVLLEQKAFIEFEQLLGIVNGLAASNYGGGVTPKQWRKLQDKFVH